MRTTFALLGLVVTLGSARWEVSAGVFSSVRLGDGSTSRGAPTANRTAGAGAGASATPGASAPTTRTSKPPGKTSTGSGRSGRARPTPAEVVATNTPAVVGRPGREWRRASTSSDSTAPENPAEGPAGSSAKAVVKAPPAKAPEAEAPETQRGGAAQTCTMSRLDFAQVLWAQRPAPPGEPPPVTLEEVAAHNTQEDAWVIYEGKVYDITEYLRVHPGGVPVLAALLGADITAAAKTQHSYVAVELILRSCVVGRLVATPARA